MAARRLFINQRKDFETVLVILASGYVKAPPDNAYIGSDIGKSSTDCGSQKE